MFFNSQIREQINDFWFFVSLLSLSGPWVSYRVIKIQQMYCVYCNVAYSKWLDLTLSSTTSPKKRKTNTHISKLMSQCCRESIRKWCPIQIYLCSRNLVVLKYYFRMVADRIVGQTYTSVVTLRQNQQHQPPPRWRIIRIHPHLRSTQSPQPSQVSLVHLTMPSVNPRHRSQP